MKAAYILFLLLLLSGASAMAANLKGTVLDTDNRPIEFASVSVFVNDSIVGGCLTDSIGNFHITVPDGCDKVRVSYIGYSDTIISPQADNLGDIILRQTGTTLKEVEVKAPLISREADRIVLNVAANPLSANKDAQELLKTAPGVWATDNSLSIYGQGGTTVFIDDRKVNLSGTQLMTYLHSIQSSTIATIEIIPKAGAEFSASSSGGVIRINIRQTRIDGLSGSAGLSTTIGEYKVWINPFANLGIHSGKWTVNLSGNLNESPSDRHTTHETSMNTNSDISLAGISHHKTTTLQGGLMLGVFYNPTDRDKVGLQIDYNPDRNNSTVSSHTDMVSKITDVTTLGSYRHQSLFHNLNVALNYSHLLDNDGSVLKWNSNYNYQHSSTDENSRMQWLPLGTDSIYTTDNANRYNIFDTEISLQKSLTPAWRLNIGLKYTHNDVRNDSHHLNFLNGDWVANPGFDFHVNYHEDIAAIYATLNLRAGRWRFKAGLRGEYYHPSGLELSKSKLDLFPNANVTFNLTERGDYTIALGYYRNLCRPSFWSLNPTVRQVSDYSYSVGNPNLRPSHTDAVSLDFVLAGKFTIAAGYSIIDNPIRQMFVSSAEYPERIYLTWGNIGTDRSGFIHGDGLINITKWWNCYVSLTYAVTSQRLDDHRSYDRFGYLQAIVSSTFMLPHSFNIILNGFFQTEMKIGNITVYPMLNINPTIQKRLGKHWSLSLGFEDVLQRTGKIRTRSAGYDRLTSTKQHLSARLGVTYNFNSGKNFRAPRIEKNNDTTRLNKD
ncbi:MAG: outer membrane beta-barrel protein [Pseudoflavonifractor sp.]|nr:outer membrane beta-barrel protein [Pseudoflavonifractor sp.]